MIKSKSKKSDSLTVEPVSFVVETMSRADAYQFAVATQEDFDDEKEGRVTVYSTDTAIPEEILQMILDDNPKARLNPHFCYALNAPFFKEALNPHYVKGSRAQPKFKHDILITKIGAWLNEEDNNLVFGLNYEKPQLKDPLNPTKGKASPKRRLGAK